MIDSQEYHLVDLYPANLRCRPTSPYNENLNNKVPIYLAPAGRITSAWKSATVVGTTSNTSSIQQVVSAEQCLAVSNLVEAYHYPQQLVLISKISHPPHSVNLTLLLQPIGPNNPYDFNVHNNPFQTCQVSKRQYDIYNILKSTERTLSTVMAQLSMLKLEKLSATKEQNIWQIETYKLERLPYSDEHIITIPRVLAFYTFLDADV